MRVYRGSAGESQEGIRLSPRRIRERTSIVDSPCWRISEGRFFPSNPLMRLLGCEGPRDSNKPYTAIREMFGTGSLPVPRTARPQCPGCGTRRAYPRQSPSAVQAQRIVSACTLPDAHPFPHRYPAQDGLHWEWDPGSTESECKGLYRCIGGWMQVFDAEHGGRPYSVPLGTGLNL